MREKDEVSREGSTSTSGEDSAASPKPSPSSSSSTKALRNAAKETSKSLVDLIVWMYRTSPTRREAVVATIILLAFLVVVARLVYLQCFATGEISIEAKTERTARKTLPHRRGGIYDRNGNVLARSVDAVDIAVHPYMVTDVNATANVLVSVLGGDAQTYAEKLTRDSTYVYIARKVDADVAGILKNALVTANKQRKQLDLAELGGFEYEDTSKRVYPMGAVAGNIVGCTGDDGHGLTGLELYYDDVLSGSDGYLIQERGVDGDPVVGGQYEREEPVDGKNIVISIDCDIQRVAQEQLSAVIATWNAGDGCVVVMHPETGELLACCSTPYLDPSNRASASTEAFNLRCVSDSYEPGSTIKPVTASMAIDMGIATPDTSYWAPSQIEVGTDIVGDADKRNYDMYMSLTNMLERSSNVGAVLCAQSVGAQSFSEYLDDYQIGHYTGIDYPGEVPGLVTRLENYTGAWEAMAFGQALAVPPIQMARAIGVIANEGILVKPHFLVNLDGEDVDYGDGERVISTSAAEEVAWMMWSVTENGYGAPGKVAGYNVSTKTGTAERASETGGYLDDQFTVSFIGFAPTEDPKAVVYVLVDYVPEGSGSETAGGPWAIIMAEALSRLQVSPS